jgi:hypothetical protein
VAESPLPDLLRHSRQQRQILNRRLGRLTATLAKPERATQLLTRREARKARTKFLAQIGGLALLAGIVDELSLHQVDLQDSTRGRDAAAVLAGALSDAARRVRRDGSDDLRGAGTARFRSNQEVRPSKPKQTRRRTLIQIGSLAGAAELTEALGLPVLDLQDDSVRSLDAAATLLGVFILVETGLRDPRQVEDWRARGAPLLD